MFSPWIGNDISKWYALTRDAAAIRYRKDAIIYYQGYEAENIYIVKTGRVRITTYEENGAEKQTYIALEGCMFGESSAFSRMSYQCSAVAIMDSYVYRISTSRVLGVLRSDPVVSLNLINFMSRKILVYQHQILELTFSQAEERIANHIIYLCEQFGSVYESDTARGIQIGIRFSHQDIANIVNTSRVTVSNVFNKFMREGILCRNERYTVVTDISRLKEIAGLNRREQ